MPCWAKQAAVNIQSGKQALAPAPAIMIYSIFIIIAIPPWKLDIIVIDNRWRSLRRVARLNLSRSSDLEAVRYWNRRCINGTFGLKVVRNQTSFFYLLILWMPWTMWSFQWWCPQGHCHGPIAIVLCGLRPSELIFLSSTNAWTCCWFFSIVTYGSEDISRGYVHSEFLKMNCHLSIWIWCNLCLLWILVLDTVIN